MLNQTRNKRGLVFTFGLCARWLASAFSLRFAQGERGAEPKLYLNKIY